MLTVTGLAKPSPRPKLLPLYRISTDKANRRPKRAVPLNGIRMLVTILLRNCPRVVETISAVIPDAVSISQAGDEERDWAARLMTETEPWVTFETKIEARGVASSPYVASLAVIPDERGNGIGSQLLRFAEDRFREGSKHLFICVSSFNMRAKALYERLGFAVVGEFKDYIVDGASEFLLHKRLR